MARFADPGRSREKIDQVVELWKERCLLGDGSLLYEDRSVWSLTHLQDFRERFLGGAIYGTDEDFEEKLDKQLDDAPAEVRLLAAELLVVYFLFAFVAIGPEAKMKIVRHAAGDWEEQPPGWELIEAAMHEGIGNPGSGYNIRRDLQLAYLLDFTIRWKALDAGRQQAALGDPWALRDFADDASEDVEVREMRHILLHLLRPEEFERISSGAHKQQIVDAFRAEFLEGSDAPEDRDEQLLRIREALEGLDVRQPDLGSQSIDFYYSPLREIWNPEADGDEGATDLALLLHKKQLVFYGPPGTSKTHRTRALADSLIRQAALQRWKAKKFFEEQKQLDVLVEESIEWVQLHPGYGYEEFVRGLRLEQERTVYQPGLLVRLVERMAKRGDDALPVVLVLDEINRTDLSRMFGEAFSLLENRGSSAVLPGIDAGEEPVELVLPDDLYVIGTMNLIDQSVEQMDFALRRRFFWRLCGFERGPIVEVNRERWPACAPAKYGWDRAVDDMERLADRAEELNREITVSRHLGAQYELGHTYYFEAAYLAGTWLKGRKQLRGGVLWKKPGQPQQPLLDLWALSIEPVLNQYLEGIDPTTARQEIERLRDVLFDLQGT
ncbi:MAG TPA: AAA family ATPase [Solirubrobacterales bacterium]|nr:AAA family ATPase [Solirubrobacterales bacterium]